MIQVFSHATLWMVCLTPSPVASHDFQMTCYRTVPYESKETTFDEVWRFGRDNPDLDISLRVGDREYWPAGGYVCDYPSGYCGGDE